MIKSLLFLTMPIYLSTIGFFLWSKNPKISSYMIPVAGFSSFVILTEILSNLFRITPKTTFILTTLILIVASLLSMLRNKTLFRSILISQAKIALIFYITYFIFHILRIVFGTFNFDFFYNTLDALFIMDYGVSKYYNTSDIFPLNWSADPMGRYGVSFLISFLNILHYSATYWAGVTFVLMIVLSGISSAVLILSLFKFANINLKIVAIFFTIFNPLTITSWHYALIGQTAGWPVFIYCIILGLSFSFKDEKNAAKQFAVFIVALFWIYPAHLLTILPLVILMVMRILYLKKFTQIFTISFYFLTLLIATVGFYPQNAFEKVSRIFLYSSKTGAESKIVPAVLNQFSSNIGPLISTGFAPYPFFFTTTIAFLTYVSLAIILMFLFAQVRFKFLGLENFFRSLTPLKILVIFFLAWYVFVFLFLKSNYLIFKISIWFMPLCVGIAIITMGQRIASRYSQPLMIALIAVVASIPFLSTTVVSFNKAISKQNVSFPLADPANAKGLNRILYGSGGNLVLSLPSAEEAAWLSLQLPKRQLQNVNYAGPPRQVLGIGFSDQCLSVNPINKENIVAWTNLENDIFPPPTLNNSNFSTSGIFSYTSASNISTLVSQNTGVFYPEKSRGWPFKNGDYFRWSNGNIAFSVWSASPKVIDLQFPIVKGPDLRKINFEKPNIGLIRLSQEESLTTVSWVNISLRSGWNCLHVMPSVPPKQLPFSSSRPDFRPLAIAIGEIKLDER
jgi:hypothetical protein